MKLLNAPHQRQQTGFSIVELMVGITLGMLVLLAIMEVFAFYEGQKRSTTTGSDAQSAGATGLYLLERDARIAGYGASIAEILGCTINAGYNGTPITLTLAPITITNGVDGASDTIRIVASGADAFSVPTTIVKDHPSTSAVFCMSSNLGFNEGDLVIAFDPSEPAKQCTMAQITVHTPGAGGPGCSVHINHNPSSPWNPAAGNLDDGTNIWPQKPPFATEGYQKNSLVFNFGNLIDRTYSINANLELQLMEFVTSTNTSNTFSLVPQMVSLQAEYGKDDGSNGGTAGDGIVDGWDNVTPATSAEWAQLLAVRIALVARSQQPEKGVVTSAAFVAENSPAWAAALIDLSLNPDGTANADWNRYRYKIFTTTVPLRNLIWRRS